jgi:hypothetical protein
MSHPLVEQAFKEFAEVGRLAVIVELKTRLLANKIPEIQSYAHANRIAETEAALLPYLKEKKLISEGEKEHLEFSRKIRNKIFHCEFESAVDLIEELRGRPLASGVVTGAKLDELDGTTILDKIMGFAKTVQEKREIKGTFKVEKTTTKEAGVFGWLLEALAKGLLNEGQQVVNESLVVLDRVFDALAKQDYERGSST